MSAITQENLGLGKGLYAIFDTTYGEIVCRLEEEKTPETVKNFVGLATGEKEYTDPRTNEQSNEPFYDGTIFHRVIKNFMVQGGDRLGQGVGGPGYRFKDEFHPELKHKGPGIFRWQIQDRIQMVLSSLLHLYLRLGLIRNTLCLEKL